MKLTKKDSMGLIKDILFLVLSFFFVLVLADGIMALSEIEVGPASAEGDELTTRSVSQQDIPFFAELLALELLKPPKTPHWVKLPSNVIYCDIYPGSGKKVKGGAAIHLHIRGYFIDGTEFVNTFRERLHFFFTFNAGETIPGFEQGIESMREGGKRIVIIPPEQGFGAEEYVSEYIYIPPYSTLILEVSLLFIREPEWDKLNIFK